MDTGQYFEAVLKVKGLGREASQKSGKTSGGRY